jgi:ankyrin repeat protein
MANKEGYLPLTLAAMKGYDLLVRDLIRAGGSPNLKSGPDEDTLLGLAAAKGDEKVVKVLLENGADREIMNKFGEMPLDVAEEKGYKEVIKLLEGLELSSAAS